MGLIVQKYGGTSVKDAERVMNVARRITDAYKAGNNVVVAVSAQGDTTDDLIEKAKEINPNASKREMDMLLSTGEQISISLLAMAIEKIGCPVISLTGWQAGVKTDAKYGAARISTIDTERLQAELDKKNIVIVAGFQGINKYDDITTLGRGGSDTSAVALAAALHADVCEIGVNKTIRFLKNIMGLWLLTRIFVNSLNFLFMSKSTPTAIAIMITVNLFKLPIVIVSPINIYVIIFLFPDCSLEFRYK